MIQCRLGLLVILVMTASWCVAADSTISLYTVISKANSLDHVHVRVQGEVIGDILNRGDHAWINIQDKTGQIGIWCKKELITDIKTLGDYNHIGDTVEVQGEFLRADIKLGGEAGIIATDIKVIKEGEIILHPVSFLKIETMAILGIVAMAMIWLAYRRQQRQ